MRRDSWTPLHARLDQNLKQRKLLQKRQKLLIAVSGGQDSLCLIKLLLDLQSKWDWQLAIGHCDHGWRPDSQANADYVRQLAESWHFPFHLQVATSALSSEAAARDWRYQCFSNLADTEGYTGIITGHTASDRAETLLYNLFRGSGTDGLQALSWQRNLTATLTLVRPLLNITRAETAQFCQEHDLRVWEDSTNMNVTYARNRIRQEVLPYIAAHFNPQIEQTLAQTAELLNHEVEYLETVATDWRQRAIAATLNHHPKSQTEVGITSEALLNRQTLKSLPLALQRRIMRQFLQAALNFSPTFSHIEKVTALIKAPNRSKTDPFPGGAVAEVCGDLIRLVKL